MFQFSDVCIATTQAVPPGQCTVPKLQGKPKATSLHLRWGRYTKIFGSWVWHILSLKLVNKKEHFVLIRMRQKLEFRIIGSPNMTLALH